MPRLSLQGALTALVTPFTADAKKVDFEAFERLVAVQLGSKISGLVPCGTTGETPTLSEAEQLELVRQTVALAKGRVPVIVGTGSNCTQDTIAVSRAAEEAGADALMIVMPYYSKPSQEGMYRHVKAVAESVELPIVLYNIPGRTAVELNVETTLRILDSSPNVVAVKDATGNTAYCQNLLARAKDRIVVLSGDDPLTLPMMSLGAKGVISVTSNLYPEQVAEMVALTLASETSSPDSSPSNAARSQALHYRLLPVHRALFSEPNPAPIKAALSLKGLMQSSLRLPMVEASEACRARLRDVMAQFEEQ